MANYAYPYFIIGGLVCFAVAAILSYFQKFIRPTISKKWDEANQRLMDTKLGPVLNRLFRLPGDEPIEAPPPQEEQVKTPKHYEKAPLRLSEPPVPSEPEQVYSDEAWAAYQAEHPHLSKEERGLLTKLRKEGEPT